MGKEVVDMGKDVSFSDYAFCENCKSFNGGRCVIRKEAVAARGTCAMFDIDQKKFEKNVDAANRKMEKQPRKPKKAEEGSDEGVIRTSCAVWDKEFMIAEQIYDGKKSMFAVYDMASDMVTYVPEVEFDGTVYLPQVGEEIAKGAILLPSAAEEYGSDEELDKEILDFINKWLDIPEEFRMFALWNIKRSWVFDRFHTLNYFRFLGDTGLGKTRGLDTLGSLHYKPIMTSGATTSAPVFRIIDKWRGTMIFDEGDFKKTDESDDIVKTINLGYEKGKFIMRCDQNDATKIMFFDPFCPKVIATRKPFEDKAVESRCMTVQMTASKRKDIPLNVNESFVKGALQLRNKLLMWRFRNFFNIDPDFRPDIDFSNLEPRVQQIMGSYLAMFGRDQASMEKFRLFMVKYQENLINERANSWQGQIVCAIHDLLEEGERHIAAQDIIDKGQMVSDFNKPLNPRALTNTLRELGFGPAITKRLPDGKTKRCLPLDQDHLNGLFARYGVTVVTVVTGTGAIFAIYEIKSGKPPEGESVTVGGAPTRDRNNRNIVTEYISENLPENDLSGHFSVPGYQEIDKIYQPCESCAGTPCEYERLMDGKLFCQVCAKTSAANPAR